MPSGDLPPGIHWAIWQELEERFGYNTRRSLLLEGLYKALTALKIAGCPVAYVDGSFISEKELPGDFDGCWEEEGVDPDLLDPVLLDFSFRRAAQKAKFKGEMFLANAEATPDGVIYFEFFQRSKDTLRPKGLIALRLEELP